MTPTKFRAQLCEILTDPAEHHYLKDTIRLFLTKDPVDAANDAEVLAEIMRDRCTLVLQGMNRASAAHDYAQTMKEPLP